MQKLMLAEDVFDALQHGKLVTIRNGRRDVQLGDLLFESVDKGRTAVVNVVMVYYTKLKDVMEEDIVNDGFDDVEDMANQMRRFYPDITLESEVTSIVFELIPEK